MNTVTLPSGATVTLKDAEDLLSGDRDDLLIAGDKHETNTGKGIAFNKALLAAVIESWSLDLIPPSIQIDSLRKLSIKDINFLTEAVKPYLDVIFPELVKTEENKADPKAPTSDSKI
jgi:hypothetical protein